MFKAISGTLIAGVFLALSASLSFAAEPEDYIRKDVSGVYSVIMFGAGQGRQAPMRIDYADGDNLVMEQGGKSNMMPIHSTDPANGTVNLLDDSGSLTTLSVRFGQGTMTTASGVKIHLSFIRKLTDMDYAAIGKTVAPVAARQQVAPASEPEPEIVTAQPASTKKASPPIAASFNCAKASTAVEGMICGNEELAALDVRVAAAYKALRSSAEDKEGVKKDQQAWLKERNACRSTECLVASYSDRAQDMENTLAYLSKPAEYR